MALNKRYARPDMRALWLDDASKFRFWFAVEVAIVRARSETNQRARQLLPLLSRVFINVQRIDELEEKIHHDRIAFQSMVQEQIDALVTQREVITAAEQSLSGEFGYGTTSYDIEDPALILMLRQAVGFILKELDRLIRALEAKAGEHQWTLCIAETHGQDAEPSTFGHLLLVYASQLRRCMKRLKRVLADDLSEGRISGSVGTYSVLSPEIERVALVELGLTPAIVETQVLQRDRHASLVANLAITARSISQIARTIHTKMRSKYRELRVKGQKGSSAMAHKRNPHKIESLLGLARKVSSLVDPALENMELMDWSDISHSSVERDILPEATGYVHYMAYTLANIVEGLEVFPANMQENLDNAHGLWASQTVRALLLEAGVAPNEAYAHVQRCCFEAEDAGVHLRELLGRDCVPNSIGGIADRVGAEKLEECFDANRAVKPGIQAIYNRYLNAYLA